MKNIYTLFNGTEITAHNKREARLCRIIISQMEDIVRYLTEGGNLNKSLCSETYNHWLIQEIAGELDACYFLGILKDATCDIAVWEMINEEFWKRFGWEE